MASASGEKDATIYMPMPVNVTNDQENIGNCMYTFANVVTVRIEYVIIFFISLNFIGKNSTFEVEHVDFYGYSGFSSSLVSVINITNSQAVLKNCTFQHNCFIRIQSNAVLQVSNCAFSSYSHALHSAIFVDNSTLELTGTVTFFNNTVGNDQYYSCGGAIAITDPGGIYQCNSNYRSIFSITKAHVYLESNTASNCGGGLYLKCTLMTVYDNVSMFFVNNVIKSKYNNYGVGGGAMYLILSDFIVNNSIIRFLNNSAKGVAHGGAIYQTQSNIYISEHGAIYFVNNSVSSLGGAIYHRDGDVITSVDKYSRMLFYNNSASQGGALYIQLSGIIQVGSDSCVNFSHNTAKKFGGAVYAYDQTCLFRSENYSNTVLFRENVAKEGVGMHVYGASIRNLGCAKSLCWGSTVRYIPSLNSSLSPVSSNPKRVCLCDLNGKPQCANISSIFVNWFRVYRGELFNISAVVVGYDFGVTFGTIDAGILPSQKQSKSVLHPDQYRQFLGSSGRVQCSNISYSLYSSNTGESLHEALSLHTSSVDVAYSFGKQRVTQLIQQYEYSHRTCIAIDLLTAPVLVNITLLAGCPLGFTLILVDRLYGCNCYPVLKNNHFKCFIIDNEGYLKWNSTIWVNATFNKYSLNESNGILLARYCPLDYCKSGEKIVNLNRDPNAQCANNHAGILCGGCKTNYSLVIGSSRCIRCSNDSSLLLFIVFITAGFLLVIFILALNLTVTEGLINGLILYANTLWIFKDILFSFKQTLTMNVLYTFIAWLNLDFGIETCLIVGLTAFWKTWLQFLFPLYIWLIAGVIIIACRYSSRLTNLIGDRAVPLLATLFLLSYTKLIRTATAIFEFEVLTHYPNQTSKSIVWYLDGSLQYCKHPHIYLFLAGLASLIFCLTVTLFLLLIQCWRRLSHLRLLRWINKFTPFYDAYFAPLKDKHHYWFGTLLLARITHLIFFTVTSSTSPLIGLLLLQFSLALLFFCLSIQTVYKSKLVRILEGTTLLNLIIFVGSTTYTRSENSLFMEISIAFSLMQFTVIIITSFSRIICKRNHKCIGYQEIPQEIDSDDNMLHVRLEDHEQNENNLRNIVDTY